MNQLDTLVNRMLFVMVAGPKGRVAVTHQQDDGPQQHYTPCDDLEGHLRRVAFLAPQYETRLGVAPVTDDGGVLRCHVLWAVLDSGTSVQKLARFRPRPTLILREGDTLARTALWALTRELEWDWTVKANRRLAHHFQGPKKFIQPDHTIRVPGSFVTDGRIVPLPIVPDEINPNALYTPAQVVKHLREPPNPNGWRQRGESVA